MKFNKQENETTYMRLVWQAKGFSKFVFVNHQGMKVVELELVKFATMLQKEIATIETQKAIALSGRGDKSQKQLLVKDFDARLGELKRKLNETLPQRDRVRTIIHVNLSAKCLL